MNSIQQAIEYLKALSVVLERKSGGASEMAGRPYRNQYVTVSGRIQEAIEA
jgi:hypothetical protein